MGKLVKCLSNMHEDLNSGPQHHVKILADNTHVYNPSAGRLAQQDLRSLLANQLVRSLNQVQREYLSQKRRWRILKYLTLTSSLHLHMYTLMCPIYAHTCKHLHIYIYQHKFKCFFPLDYISYLIV